jgi:uncharacterized protein YndB with AHSA1/START domain
MTEVSEFVLERRFDAPPDLVWKVWTEEAYQSRWYGPGVETIVHRNELQSGGQWLVEMKGDGWSAHQRADYLDVDRPDRLAFLQSVTDADWNVIPNPAMPDWPRVLRTDIGFAGTDDGATDMRLVWSPHEPTEAEVAFFAGSLDGLGQGWSAGMDILDTILSDLRD